VKCAAHGKRKTSNGALFSFDVPLAALLPALCGSRIEERTVPDTASIPAGRTKRASKRKKKLTRGSMRRLVKQLIRFFREHPECDLPALRAQESNGLGEAA